MKIKTLLIALSVLFLLTGCFEGYTGRDGIHLKKYLEPEAMKELLNDDSRDILVIDVRPSGAYERGHLPGALSMPSSEVKERYTEIGMDQDVIVYCETGGRAQKVIELFEEKGYTQLMNWGGYTRWEWDYETSLLN